MEVLLAIGLEYFVVGSQRFLLDGRYRLDLEQVLVVLVGWLVDRMFPLDG
jgi:hypothetical protein